MGKLKKIGKSIAALSLNAGHALNKAAARRDKMERQFNRFFGPDGLRNKGVKADKAREKANMDSPTSKNFFRDNRNKDQGIKKEKYFGDVDKSKLVSADMDGKDEGVQQDKFFEKSSKKKIKGTFSEG